MGVQSVADLWHNVYMTSQQNIIPISPRHRSDGEFPNGSTFVSFKVPNAVAAVFDHTLHGVPGEVIERHKANSWIRVNVNDLLAFTDWLVARMVRG